MTGNRENAGRPVAARVLGGFALAKGDGRDVSLANRKACGLLAYLMLGLDGSAPREQLAGLLWSEHGEGQARASLRQCLRQLRSVFDEMGFAVFDAGRQYITLEKTQLSIDLLDIDARLSRGEVAENLVDGSAAPERILYGFEDLDPSFAAWLSVVRQRWRDRLVGNLEPLLVGRNGVEPRSTAAARALLTIDPTHEEAHRCLITAYANEGNTASALRQYNELWTLLDEDYDMEPADETQALIAAIKAGTYRAIVPMNQPEEREPPRVRREDTGLPVIGVWPFGKGGPWTLGDFPIEGFRREIVAALIRFREWVVVDGQEVAEAKNGNGRSQSAPLPPIHYLLEGTYYEDGGAVRLIITLKEATTKQYVWSERMMLTFENWLAVQQSIVRRLAVALNVYLSAERVSGLVGRTDAGADAHVKWLKGYNNLFYWNPDNERQAEEIFKDIIERTPEFSPAYSSLVSVINSRHFKHPGFLRDPADARQALHLAQQAVELDPLDTRAQLALGFSYALNNRFDQAEFHFNLTLELNPNSPITLVPCAHGLSYCGRHDVAGKLAEAAVEMNPLMPRFHWGYILCIRFLMKDFEGAIQAAEMAQDAITDLHGWKAAALAQSGLEAESKEMARFFVEIVRERWEGAVPPTDSEVVRWFMQCFPIRRTEDYELLREGLVLAGLPAADGS